MESEIILFASSLFLTFFITRVLAYKLHDRENYGTAREKSKTLTGFLRKRTGWDIHHLHFGILFLLILIPLILFYSLNSILIIFLAISLSLFLDQAVPWVANEESYFSRKNLAVSAVAHIIVALIFVQIMIS